MRCCGLKSYFDAQRIDTAGRHAVRLQKCALIIGLVAVVRLMLAILFDPISALFVFSVCALLTVVGWKAASRRSTSMLLAYQILASFVFMGIVAIFTFSLVFSLTMIAASGGQQPVPMDVQPAEVPTMTLQPPAPATPTDYTFRSKAAVLSVFDAHAPTAVTSRLPFMRSALATGLSFVTVKQSSSTGPSSEPNMEGLPGLDGMTAEVDTAAQEEQMDGTAVVAAVGVVGVFLLASCCLLVLILAVVLMSFVFFGVMPFVALLCSIFFAAACRRSLLIQRYANEQAQAAACPAVAIQVPAAVPVPAPGVVAAANPAAAAAAAAAPAPMMVPANMVYMPHTNMFPMASNGYVANPYSGVIYVSGSSGEPTKQ